MCLGNKVMSPLLVALVLACATSSFAESDDDPPMYANFLIAADRAVEELRTHLSINSSSYLRDPNRHYIVILNVLLELTERLEGNKSAYGDIYLPTIDAAVPDGYEFPVRVVKKVEALVELIHDEILPIRDLIDATCEPTEEVDVCSQVVDRKVRGDPKRYKRSADVLEVVGYVSYDYDYRIGQEFDSVAEEYRVIEYLLQNQDNLEVFIMHLLKVTSLVNNRD